MARDIRLKGLAFNALVVILKEALPNPQQIGTIAIQLDAEGEVALAGNANDQWTSLLNYAGKDSKVFDELLNLIDGNLEATKYYAKFLSWCGRGRHDKLDQAVSDLQAFTSALLKIRDPREAQDILELLRSSIMEIKEMIAAAPGKVTSGLNMLVAITEKGAAARGKILEACGDALNAVDQLIIDIAEAEEQSAWVRREYGGQEAFIVGQSMTRHLLDDRGRVDRRSDVLLQVMNKQLAHLEITAVGSEPEQAAPQQRAEPQRP